MKRFSLWRKTTDQHEPLQSDEPSVVDGISLGGEGKRFGIRSYINQFYLSSPTVEDLEDPSAWYLMPPPPMQRMSYLWRIFSIVGLLLVLAGIGLIVVGYTWKPATDDLEVDRIAIAQNEDGDFYIDKNRLDELLHQNDKLKVSGFIVFALGGIVLALSMTIPTCVHFFARNAKRLPFSEDNTPNEAPIRVFPSVGSRFKVTPTKLGGQRISPTSGPIPVMEHVQSVQPKRSPGHSPTADQLLVASGESDALLS